MPGIHVARRRFVAVMRLAMWTSVLIFAAALPLCAADLATTFRNPPPDARMTTYWIWFGPAITRQSIDHDLANMKQAHIGGTVLLPVYPLSEDGNLPFLSPDFLDMLGYAAKRSREMGLSLDLIIGSGWPYGGPWITPELGARMLRMRKAGEPLKTGEEIVGIFGDRVAVSMPTGMQVKRPSVGGEGLVLDHLNRRALERHLEVAGEKLWQAVRDARIRSFWCDSLEVYGTSWTPGFLEDFRKLRGYNLAPLLPLLFGEANEEARHVRYDFWQTISELAVQNFHGPLQQWCRRKGVDLRMESYGQPPVALGSFRYVDRPIGEHYQWRMFNASRWASSGAHLHARNIVGAEAWTWIGTPNRFTDSLSDLKLASDMHFVSGVNELMGVSYVNTPESAGTPGWATHWGPVINHNQTWWPYFPLLSRYVQRVSHLLRQGRPVADVALYLPSGDAFAQTPADAPLNLYFAVRNLMNGKPAPEFGLGNAITDDTPVISTIIGSGYSLDGIDSSTLPNAVVSRGRLKMGLGEYRIVVLPNLAGMPLADAEKLAAFARSGGHVIATRRLPEVAYGWRRHKEDTERLRTLLREIRVTLVPDDRDGLRAALRAAVPPDLALETPDRDIAFVHRQVTGADLYFIASLGEECKSVGAKFRAGAAVQVWDPITGDTSGAWDGTLRLDSRGSVVVVVRAGPEGGAHVHRAAAWEAGPRPAEWRLTVPGRAAQRLEQLVSWTEIEPLRHFSGSAEYETSADLALHAGTRVQLDLGDVREIADVWVNGKHAGAAWKKPYRLDVTSLVHSGHNSIRVRVTNLLINAVLGSPPPDYSRLRAKFGDRFPDPSERKTAKPLPSGLLGPVRILTSTGGCPALPNRQ